ncbi:MAG: endonuclease MutS2 [Corallococcus sp.]|nr:endonuclease MutS2 [Corallococcus sp.]MCM1359179.1 endonuclease MutS2 [Corallococcus sp.]MCM1394569.1 endonuclease MutS2 [Corallococcus sp.]
MINEKTLKKLQYKDILQQVSSFAISSVAKNKVLNVLPAQTFEEAQNLLLETKQAFDLFQYETSFDLSVDDVKETCALARVGSCLSMGQLLQVMRTLRTSRNLQTSILADYGIDIGTLQTRAYALYADKQLEEDIDFAVISEEEMNDKASDELFSIRKKIKDINADIKQKLQSYTKNGELSKYLQDSIVTLRGDRYVIPVKQEYKAFVNGIVHDQSSTGATLFIEPAAIVQLNNALREEVLEERAEIQRILQAFTDRISPAADRILVSEETVSDIDVIFAKVKYAIENKCTLPILNDEGILELKKARHPLLDKRKVVPVSVKLGKDYDIIVVTGPNTGGKTVTLKTVGLMCLLAMSGMFLPCAEESSAAFFADIFCDIGDEQSIEQNLSTFSGHIVNLRDILNKCSCKDLVLIDEVGAGTEPNEGTALALAVTEFLRKSGAKCVITTHYGKLKEYSLTTARVENASMEFDLETLEPTYRLIMGVPGSSNALAIAKKLGLRQDVIDFARDNVSDEKLAFEKVLQNAEKIRKQYEEELHAVEEEKRRLENERLRAEQLNGSLQKDREKMLSGSRRDADKIVEKAKAQAEEIIAELKHILSAEEISDKELFAARAKAKELKNIKIEKDVDGEEMIFTGDKVDFAKLKVGDFVYSQKLAVQVKVVEIKNCKRIGVRCGALATEVSADDLYYCVAETNKKTSRFGGSKSKPKTEINTRSFNNEINVLGQTVDEAIGNVDIFIDQAVLAGMNKIWIIHGMGTGRLRAGLHAHLRAHPNVLEFRLGKYGEGESGVTVVTLK